MLFLSSLGIICHMWKSNCTISICTRVRCDLFMHSRQTVLFMQILAVSFHSTWNRIQWWQYLIFLQYYQHYLANLVVGCMLCLGCQLQAIWGHNYFKTMVCSRMVRVVISVLLLPFSIGQARPFRKISKESWFEGSGYRRRSIFSNQKSSESSF